MIRDTPGSSVPLEEGGHGSYAVAQRAWITAEVLFTYARVWVLMRQRKLPEVLERLRRSSSLRPIASEAFRLAWIVERVLAFVPADTRCLMRSLVLLAMLERRKVASTLVIGTSTEEEFGAHAWIERDGQALLWTGGTAFDRLVEL